MLRGIGRAQQGERFVIQDGCGQVIAQGEMPTTPEGFRRWHEAQQLPVATPVALETGTVAFFVGARADGAGVRTECDRCPRGAAQGAAADAEE